MTRRNVESARWMHDEYPDRYVTAAEALQMSNLEVSQVASQLRRRADFAIRRAYRYGNQDATLRSAALDEWIGLPGADNVRRYASGRQAHRFA